MILAVDTWYFENKARTACIGFLHWDDADFACSWTEELDNIAAYEPGAFYKRELPCILGILKKTGTDNITCIIIDGFVYLDDDNAPGLGAYLYEALGKQIPVVGVAKTDFLRNRHNKKALLRGSSKTPLFITAAGITAAAAAEKIALMHGDNRIPTLLAKLDRMTREK